MKKLLVIKWNNRIKSEDIERGQEWSEETK